MGWMEEHTPPPVPALGEIPSLPTVLAWFRQIKEVDLAELEQRFVRAIERNHAGGDATRDGFPSGRPGSGGQDAGTSVESAALATYELDDRNDVDNTTGHWSPEQLDAVAANLLAGCDHLHRLLAALNGAQRRMKEDARLATLRPAYDPSGHCKACARWVPGTSIDRLRAGYCDACRKAYDRFATRERDEGREPDRAAFERQRPKVDEAVAS